MNNERVKIIEAVYDGDKQFVKLKVEKIDTGNIVKWAMTADSFDSFIGQISTSSLTYTDEQRLVLCNEIINLEFFNKVKIDIDNPDIDKAKEKGVTELQHCHNAVDMYPFYEIQQEAIEEATQSKGEQRES